MANENNHGERCAHHTEIMKNEMLTRLARIEGQIRGIAKMIANDVYCDDVLNQMTSVHEALNGVKNKLLEAHMKSCVIEQIRSGNDTVIDELLKTIRKMMP